MSVVTAKGTRKPRLGFLGVGWIGRHRMEAIAKSGVADAAVVADASYETAAQAAALAPDAEVAASIDELLNAELDGVVIATPSALHAGQAIAALERGLAVFCQKPLGRNAEETARVVAAARANDLLLGVDLSYRFITGMDQIRDLVQNGELGRVFSVNLVFHNAYGPDKAWFYDAESSGGGCVIDLGIHLVDLALWTLQFPQVTNVSSRLFAGGEPLRAGQTGRVEDYAAAQIDLEDGATLQLACSWKLQAGRDCVIEAAFYGTRGGAALSNVNGSFYDFEVERFHGTHREVISRPPDEWGGRAVVDWARRLAAGEGFDAECERLVEVAQVLDRIYGR